MTPAQFRASARILFAPHDGWGASAMAEFLGISVRNAQRFAAGEKPIGPDLEKVLLSAVENAILGPRKTAAGEVIFEALSLGEHLPTT